MWKKLTKIAENLNNLAVLEDPLLQEADKLIQRAQSRYNDTAITGIINFEQKSPIPTIKLGPDDPPVEWECVIQKHNAKRAGCLTGGTRIITDKGRIRIQEIVNKRLPIKVLSYNFRTGKLEWKRVVNWYKNGTSTEWIRLRFHSRRGSITLTGNHKVYVYVDGKIIPKLAKDVRKGDYMLMPVQNLTEDQKQFILGALLGDGSIPQTTPWTFNWGQVNKEYFDFGYKLLSPTFKMDVEIRQGKGKRQDYYYFRIKHPWFYLLRNILYKDGKKRITKEILDMIDERALAVWYMDDGQYVPGGDYVIKHSARYKRRPRSDRGKRISPHQQILLHTLGFPKEDVQLIITWLREKYEIHATLRNRTYPNGKTYYYISINRKKSIERFLKLVAPYIAKGMEYKCPLDEIGYYNWTAATHNEMTLLPVPIREIKYIKVNPSKPLERYDIEVEDNHNYFAGSLLVSNSHLDFRLGDPKTKIAYSWAGRYWPMPGERRLFIRQPDHTMDYMNFSGRIPDGYYGAGTVTIEFRGKADILSADDSHIRFNIYRANETQEYLLTKGQGDNWYMINVTDTRDKLLDLPEGKEKYKEITPEEAIKRFLNDDRYIFTRKDDGVQVLLYVKPDGKVKLFSPRWAVSTSTGLIEHTYKVPPYGKFKVPSSFKGSIFRAELFLTDEKGQAKPINEIVSVTHSETPISRKLIESKKVQPRLTVFDVVKFKDQYVEKELPYKEKLRLINEFVQHFPYAEPPQAAFTKEEKQMLFDAIRTGSIPESKEGIVIQNLEDVEKPVKAKFKPEYDVYVVGIFESSSPNWRGKYAGGIEYSFEPNGPVVGRVGAGFTMEQRKDMAEHPEKYIGRVAKIRAAGQYPDGALRQPVFIGWHPEKGKEFIEKVASKTPDPERWDNIIVDAPFGSFTKRDIFLLYMQPKIRKNLLNELKQFPQVIVMQAFDPSRIVLRRNIDEEKIKIKQHKGDVDNPEDFQYWIERRTVEFHPSFGAITDRLVVDIDPGPDVDFDQIKEVTKKVRDFMKKDPDIKQVEVRFSGGRGFYVIGYLKKKRTIDEARDMIKRKLQQFITASGAPDKYTITKKPGKGQIRLDISPMKYGGSYRGLFSMNLETGLLSVPVTNIDEFKPEQASMENIISNIKPFEPKRP